MSRIDIRPPVYSTGFLIPEQFGAAGDGTTDDNAALTRMFAAGNNYVLTPGKTYLTSASLTVPRTCRLFDMTGSKITFGSGFDTTTSVLTFGDTTDNLFYATIRGLYVERPSGLANWSGNANNCVVRIYNPKYCHIETIWLRGMSIGLQILAEGGTLQSLYNTFTLGMQIDNQVGMDLRSNTSGCAVNQNTFIGGSFRVSGSTQTGTDAIGIRYSFGSGGYEFNNNNLHLNPSFELNPGGAGVRTPIVMTSGQRNTFIGIRAETYTDHIARLSGTNCENNIVDVSYYDGTLQMADTATGAGNRLRSVNQGLETVAGWNSGPLVDRLYHYNSTDVSLRGVLMCRSSDDAYTTVTNRVATAMVMRRDWVEVGTTTAIGVFVDTSLHKMFRVWRNCIGSAGGRIYVNAYDADGTVITDGTGVLSAILVYSGGSYGGRHGSTSDSAASFSFRVSDACKRIRVLVGGGSAAAQIRSFGISPTDGSISAPLSVWEDPKHGGRSELMASATIPSTYGRFSLGDEVLNNGATTAISTGLRGWKCTTAGAFAPAWAATTAYVAGQLVWNDTNKIYWCKTGGTSAGSGGPTGSTEATDIADNTVTWRYLCPLAVFTTMYSESLPSQNGTVSTTDATVTTILTIPITTNAQTTLMVMVSARRTGGSGGAAADGASYIRGVSVKDNAGTPTIIGSSAMMTDQESQAGWDVTFDISTTNLRVRVTGAANNNIDWSASASILAVT